MLYSTENRPQAGFEPAQQARLNGTIAQRPLYLYNTWPEYALHFFVFD